MKSTLVVVSGLVISLAFLSCGAEKSDFTLVSFIGSVKIVSEGETVDARANMALKIGDVVTSGRRSSARIKYGDAGIFRLSPGGRLRVGDINGDETGADLDLEKGSLFCALAKTKKKGFRVKTPTVVASVRGTVFIISADSKKSRVSVLRGRVRANPLSGKKELVKQGRLVSGGKRATVTKNEVSVMEKKGSRVRVEKIPPVELKRIRKNESWYNWNSLVRRGGALSSEISSALDKKGNSLRKITDHKASKKKKTKRKIWEFAPQKEEKKDRNLFDSIRESEKEERKKNGIL